MRVKNPILVMGAPRSGKKVTSEVLSLHPQVSAFPCEMTYAWRHGHGRLPYDSLQPETATPRIVRYLQRVFAGAARPDSPRVVDRTDHNVVRMEYVRKVFPDCVILHLVRDARASVASAMQRRKRHPGWKYLLQKAASVPLTDIPQLAVLYGWDVVRSRMGKERYRKLWGIRTPTTVRHEAESALSVKCAVQWRECVSIGLASQSRFRNGRDLVIRYEEMVQNPIDVFREVFAVAELDWTKQTENWIRANVRQDSLELWKENLTREDLRLIEPFIGELMDELGYRDRPLAA